MGELFRHLQGEGLPLRYGVEPEDRRDKAPACNVIEFDSGKVLVTLRQPGGEEESLARFSGQAVATSEIYPEQNAPFATTKRLYRVDADERGADDKEHR